MKRLLSLKASAGSGKTFSLAGRYLGLLFKNIHPNNILAVTFTNKAANEMKERIVKYLQNLENEDDMLNFLEKEGFDKKEILRKKEDVLKRFLKSDIKITTIDSFIQRILRKFWHFADISLDFEIKSDNLSNVFREFLESLNKNEFERFVNFAKIEEKKESSIIDFFELLYEKDKELLKIKKRKYEIKDIRKIVEEIEKIKNELILGLDGCSDSARKIFQKPVEGILSSKVVERFYENGSLKYPRSYFNKCFKPWMDEKFAKLLDLTREYYSAKETYILNTLFEFYEKYKKIKEKIKKDEGYLDFKDIEHLVYKILVEDELNKDFLYFRLDSKITHILIDEFQDTSVTQWEIFEPLVDEIKAGEGIKDFRSFFYVGDTKQAIYRFRGGNSELFDYVYEILKPYGMVQEELPYNYRSKEVIVEFVNRLFNLNQKAIKQGGYVEVSECDKEDIFDEMYKKTELLLQKGANLNDICILVYRNDDILDVASFLENRGLKCVTSTRAKVKNQPFARGIIDFLKYLYFDSIGKKAELYKMTFLSVTGKKYSPQKIEFKIERPSVMIKKIMDKYSLYDESSLKLLEHSLKYNDIIEFVYKIDEWDEELPLSEFEGINIMTIHKSKGLEFENVIVLDRLSKKRNSTGTFIFEYEGVWLKGLKYAMKNREKVDMEYKKALDINALEALKDDRNVEYVAFTRAKNSLFIIKRKDTYFVSNPPVCVEGMLEIEKKEKEQKPLEKFDKKLTYVGRQEGVEESEYKPNDYEAIYYGLALHYAFEVEDFDAVLNRYGIYTDTLKAFKEYEEAQEKIDFEGKIYKELPFVYNGKEGVIDLMIENDEEIVIIDYKSTRPEDERGYVKQVEFYKKAMEKIKGKKTKGYLFYVDERKLRSV